MSDTSNILLSADRPHVQNCIIIRKDASDYFLAIDETGIAGVTHVQNVDFICGLPTLWRWIRLWFTWRHLRRHQPPPRAVIIDQSFASKFDRVEQQ